MKLSKKEILSNYEKYKDREIKIGCLILSIEDLSNKAFKNDDIFEVERKLEDFLSQDEIECLKDIKRIIEESSEENRKIIIDMLLKGKMYIRWWNKDSKRNVE